MKKLGLCLLIPIVVWLFSSCSNSSIKENKETTKTEDPSYEGPSDEVIKSTIIRDIWCRDVEITEFVIQKKGVYNEEKKYWPVRVSLKATGPDIINKHKREKFSDVGDYKVYKDDFGEWKAGRI